MDKQHAARVRAALESAPSTRIVNATANAPRGWGIAKPAALLQVFLPYLCFDTVFDNTRVTTRARRSDRDLSMNTPRAARLRGRPRHDLPVQAMARARAQPDGADLRMIRALREAAGPDPDRASNRP